MTACYSAFLRVGITNYKMKTHKVIDLVYHEDEGNEVYAGTYEECFNWKAEQGYGYQVVPMTRKEIEFYKQI
jgi:hypothetical protein